MNFCTEFALHWVFPEIISIPDLHTAFGVSGKNLCTKFALHFGWQPQLLENFGYGEFWNQRSVGKLLLILRVLRFSREYYMGRLHAYTQQIISQSYHLSLVLKQNLCNLSSHISLVLMQNLSNLSTHISLVSMQKSLTISTVVPRNSDKFLSACKHFGYLAVGKLLLLLLLIIWSCKPFHFQCSPHVLDL